MRYGLYRGGLWGTSITNNAVWLTWTVDEAQPGGSNAELTLQWNQADELNGFNRQRCMIARHGSAGWLYLQPPGAASGSGPYTRTVTGVVAFSPFSVGDSAASLPVRLQSFSASAEGRAVQLRWETASESGCHGFEVQRKMPGFDWMAVGFVPCANEGGHRYAYSDVPGEAMHTETELLYRLVMRDADGSSETSHELTVRFDESPQGLSLGDPYPQPAIEAVTVPFTLDASSVITMSLYTATGKKACVLVEGREFPRGSHALTAVLNGLAAGPYMLELRGGWAVRTAVLLLKGR
jgi:hypothetical protein